MFRKLLPKKFKSYYDLHDMDEERKKIRKLRKITNNNVTNENIKKIILLFKRHSMNTELLPGILTTISNYCMNQINVARFDYCGGIKLVIKTQKLFKTNSKIQWLICSCIWNICRVPTSRNKFKNDLLPLIKNIKLYSNDLRVLNTTFGSLSNISLLNENRVKLLQLHICKNLNLFFKSMLKDYKVTDKKDKVKVNEKYVPCLISAMGLIANLAIDNSDKFIKNKLVYLMIKCIKLIDISMLIEKEPIIRNFSTSLNNLADRGEDYKKQINEAGGHELIYDLYMFYMNSDNENDSENDSDSDNQVIIELLEMVLRSYIPENYIKDTDLKDFKTNTLHICAFNNYIDILVCLLGKKGYQNNVVDNNKNTILHVAINGKSLDVIKYICSIGILREVKNNDNLTMHNLIKLHSSNDQEEICHHIQNGYILHDKYRKKFNSIFFDIQPDIPYDLIDIFLQYTDINKYQYEQMLKDTKKVKKIFNQKLINRRYLWLKKYI